MLETANKKQHGAEAHDDAASESSGGGAQVAAPAGLPLFLQRSPESQHAAPMSFPHAARIRGALRTDAPLEGVFDPAGCAARGTPAFTDGEVTHFAGESPGLHVAAHEAAHQLQHAGVAHDFGLGAEGHASAVADAVASGSSAAGLVGLSGARVASARRNYTKTDAQGNPSEEGSARLSDTGETMTFGSPGAPAYATEAQISQSNGILQARNSGVKLSSGGGGLSVEAPDRTGKRSLSLVKVEIEGDKAGMTMPGDCREAAIEVMGATGASQPEAAVCQWGGRPTSFQKSEEVGPPRDIIALMNFTDKRIRQTPGYDAMSDEEKLRVREKAKSDFYDLSREQSEKLREVSVSDERAKELGIDQYAAPRVGEAYAVIRTKAAGDRHDTAHWAGVVMVAGADRVTLENFGGDPGQRTKNWRMQTYGPESKYGQTFHEQWLATEDRHTLTMQTQPQPPDYAGKMRGMTTFDLFARYRASADPEERSHLERELRGRTVMVDVRANKTDDVFSDDVYVLVGNGSGLGWSSGAASFSEGQGHTFSLQLSKVWPVGETLFVNLFDLDLTGDDLIGVVNWAAPFFPRSDVTLSNGEASYTVSLTMSGGSLAAPPP